MPYTGALSIARRHILIFFTLDCYGFQDGSSLHISLLIFAKNILQFASVSQSPIITTTIRLFWYDLARSTNKSSQIIIFSDLLLIFTLRFRYSPQHRVPQTPSGLQIALNFFTASEKYNKCSSFKINENLQIERSA